MFGTYTTTAITYDPTQTTFFPLTGGCSEGLDAFRFFFKHTQIHTRYVNTSTVLSSVVLFMSILGGFVPNIECYLSRWISEIRRCRLARTIIIIIIIQHRKKHKTLSYLSVLTVIGSRMCTTSELCGIRGVQPGSLLRSTSLQIPVKETISTSQRCLVC